MKCDETRLNSTVEKQKDLRKSWQELPVSQRNDRTSWKWNWKSKRKASSPVKLISHVIIIKLSRNRGE